MVIIIASIVVKDVETMMHVMMMSLNYALVTSKAHLHADKEFHLTNCKLKSAAILEHRYFLCIEVNIDADIPATCWLSIWWD